MLRKKNAIWPGIIQQPVNAGSRRIGVKTVKPGLDYRPHYGKRARVLC